MSGYVYGLRPDGSSDGPYRPSAAAAEEREREGLAWLASPEFVMAEASIGIGATFGPAHLPSRRARVRREADGEGLRVRRHARQPRRPAPPATDVERCEHTWLSVDLCEHCTGYSGKGMTLRDQPSTREAATILRQYGLV